MRRPLACEFKPGPHPVLTLRPTADVADASLAFSRGVLTLQVTTGVALWRGVRTRLTLGEGVEESSTPELRIADPEHAWTELTREVVAGRPASRVVLEAARAAVVSPGWAPPRRFWDADLDKGALDAVLDPMAWMNGEGGRIVASPGLTLACEAGFASVEEARYVRACLDGREGAQELTGEGSVRWTWPGPQKGTLENWRRKLTLDRDGREASPVRLDWVLRFPGALDAATGSENLQRANFYGREQDGDRVWCWTGPDRRAVLRAPFGRGGGGGGRLRLKLVGNGDLELPDELSVELDGSSLQLSRAGDSVFEAEFDAGSGSASAVTELALEPHRMFQPSADPRMLGIAVAEVEFRLRG